MEDSWPIEFSIHYLSLFDMTFGLAFCAESLNCIREVSVVVI